MPNNSTKAKKGLTFAMLLCGNDVSAGLTPYIGAQAEPSIADGVSYAAVVALDQARELIFG